MISEAIVLVTIAIAWGLVSVASVAIGLVGLVTVASVAIGLVGLVAIASVAIGLVTIARRLVSLTFNIFYQDSRGQKKGPKQSHC